MPTSSLLKVIAACSGIVWIIALIVAGTVPASWKLVTPMSLASSAAVALAWAIDRWGWALWGLRTYFGRPDLRGTWEGTIVSRWIPAGGTDELPALRVFMVVGQTLSSLHLRQLAEKSDSITLVASLASENDGEWTVLGLYENDSEEGEVHSGGFRMRARGETGLDGVYWTTRQTRGRLSFRRISRERVASYSDALALAAGLAPPPTDATTSEHALRADDEGAPAPQLAGAASPPLLEARTVADAEHVDDGR